MFSPIELKRMTSTMMLIIYLLNEIKNLETVDFGDCLCRNRGSVEICKQLKHTQVKDIVLSGNEIGYDAARQILEHASRIGTLQTLSIGTNCFGGRFQVLRHLKDSHEFLDVGEESEDEGTGDEESEDDDDNESEEDNEEENENDQSHNST